MWEAAMGVIYRGHRKSLKSQNLPQWLGRKVREVVCQLLSYGYSVPALSLGKPTTWGSQSYMVRSAEREGWNWGFPQWEQGQYLRQSRGLPGGGISGKGPWRKKKKGF